MNLQYPCKICKVEMKDKDTSICSDICNVWSHTECVNICPEIYEQLQNCYVFAWYFPNGVRCLPLSDLKELKIFLFSDTIEHTLKPQKNPKQSE